MTDITHMTLWLAQDGAGGAEPGSAAGPATTGAPGTPGAANGTAAPGGGSNFMLIMMLGLGAVMLYSLVFGQRREKKRRESMLNSIRKHDEVQTAGGVIGSVVEIKNDRIVLKVDEASNTRITFSRSAVQHVVNSSGEKSEPDSSNKN
ncbi:MAG: preprotein translocase subunit YajC [Phycisphaerales bacterium]|nr:preprotein translocase subunit YajC [Phycisphaerales bacterium]